MKKTTVQTIQTGFYACSLNQLDTVSKTAKRIWGNAMLANPASYDGFGGIHFSKIQKPYISTMIIVPPSKGLYYIQVSPQPGTLVVNNEYSCGLRVNFAVSNKHWNLYRQFKPDDYNNNLTILQNSNSDGYGSYYFRVE